MLKSESGQALPMALLALILTIFTVVPGLVFMDISLNGQRQAKQILVDEYSADSAITYVLFKMKTVAGYATNPCGTPPCTETTPTTVNGATRTVKVIPPNSDFLVEESFTMATGTTPTDTSFYPLCAGGAPCSVPPGHQIWLIAINETPGSGNNIYFGYDSVDYPATATFPLSSGTVTYYLRDSPTPPTGNGTLASNPTVDGNEALTMDSAGGQPSGPTLYNYDTDFCPGGVCDTKLGRTLNKNPSGSQCYQAVQNPTSDRIIWRGPTLLAGTQMNIGSVPTARWWWAQVTGFAQTARLRWMLCDYNPLAPISGGNPKNPVDIVANAPADRAVNALRICTLVGSRTITAVADKVGNNSKMLAYQIYGAGAPACP